jgi:hypothetical protein
MTYTLTCPSCGSAVDGGIALKLYRKEQRRRWMSNPANKARHAQNVRAHRERLKMKRQQVQQRRATRVLGTQGAAAFTAGPGLPSLVPSGTAVPQQ